MTNLRTTIPIENIRVAANRPTVLTATVDALTDSIKQVGLLNPLTIDKHGNLISGAHRLEACRRLGWEEVDVNMVSLEGLQAELAEIDENLIRNNDLHFLRVSEQLARRKEIYEALRPETKATRDGGAYRGNQHEVSEIISPTFTEDTANKLGVSRRTVEQSVQMAENLTPEAKEAIVKNELPKSEAIAVAREEPDMQVPKVLSFAHERNRREETKLKRDIAQIDYDYDNISAFRDALMGHHIYSILDNANTWLPSVAAEDEDFPGTIEDIDRVIHALNTIKSKLIFLKGGRANER